MNRLALTLAHTLRPPTRVVEYTDGPVASRHTRYALLDVLEPGSGRVLKTLRGPDTFRQFQTWCKDFSGFPLIRRSYFLGACIETITLPADHG